MPVPEARCGSFQIALRRFGGARSAMRGRRRTARRDMHSDQIGWPNLTRLALPRRCNRPGRPGRPAAQGFALRFGLGSRCASGSAGPCDPLAVRNFQMWNGQSYCMHSERRIDSRRTSENCYPAVVVCATFGDRRSACSDAGFAHWSRLGSSARIAFVSGLICRPMCRAVTLVSSAPKKTISPE